MGSEFRAKWTQFLFRMQFNFMQCDMLLTMCAWTRISSTGGSVNWDLSIGKATACVCVYVEAIVKRSHECTL